jgi:sorbitol/mannitol transport system permease protein
MSQLTRVVTAAFTWVVILIIVSPVAVLVMTALKPEGVAHSAPPTVVFVPVLDNFLVVLRDAVPFALNSIAATGITTLLCLVLAAPAAYALAVRPVRQWRGVLFFLISTRALPPIAGIIPIFLIVKTLGMLDQIPVLVVIYTATNTPVAVWMLRSYFAEVPQETVEASALDGAGFLRQLSSVVLPLSAPGVAATALLVAVFAWNEYLIPLVLTSTGAETMPVYVASFNRPEGLFVGVLAAAGVLAILPSVIAGWIVQRHLARGLAFGAVK